MVKGYDNLENLTFQVAKEWGLLTGVIKCTRRYPRAYTRGTLKPKTGFNKDPSSKLRVFRGNMNFKIPLTPFFKGGISLVTP